MAECTREISRDRVIPLSKPSLGEKEVEWARQAILSGWVTQGPMVKTFEEEFASYVGTSHACAVSNCTAALHMALTAVGVRPGDVVLTVSHSFIGTANSVRYCGAEPIFIDIDLKTLNMSPESLGTRLADDCEKKSDAFFYRKTAKLAVGQSPLVFVPSERRGRIAAILVVHQFGMPCDLESIASIAKKYQLPIVEDAACAIGSEIRRDGAWELIGKPYGEIACFSFHPRKVITTGEGGMLTTNNRDLDRQLRLLRNHGVDVAADERRKTKGNIIGKYITMGFNYRMTDIQAAIGIQQLRRLPEFLNKRRQIHQTYKKILGDIPWLVLPEETLYARANWQSYPLRVLENAPVSRDEVIQYLFDYGVSCAPAIRNAHHELPYNQVHWTNLTQSDIAEKYFVLFPFFMDLSESDIAHIGKLLKKL